MRLRFPAGSEYGHLAGVVARHLAERQGFPEAGTSDLGTAADKAVGLLSNPDHPDSWVTFTFKTEDSAVTIEAQVGGEHANPVSKSQINHFAENVGPLVDWWKLDAGKGHLSLRKSGKEPGF